MPDVNGYKREFRCSAEMTALCRNLWFLKIDLITNLSHYDSFGRHLFMLGELLVPSHAKGCSVTLSIYRAREAEIA